MKVLIALYHPFELWTAPEWLAPRLRKTFPEHQIAQLAGPKYEGIEREIADAEVAIAWSLRPEQFALARKLKWLHSPAAAVHQLMFPEMLASDVVVTNARQVHGAVVAEHAMALIFALAKRLPSALRYQVRKEWGQTAIWEERPTTREVEGATVVLVGMGSIGAEFAKRAKALGMKVIGVREHPGKGSPDSDEVVSTEQLDTVLPRADFVVLAAPLTGATLKLFDRRRLELMRADSYLVNVSRGPLVDEDALAEILKEKKIAGAGLDVFRDEPLPESSPFWELENALITPHTAAVTERLWERHFVLISENIRRYVAGKPLLGSVDKKKGY
jgi:phosphoglycerate dehydrogenase-like enzyme